MMDAVPVLNPVSPQAKVIADFTNEILIICAIIFVIVTTLIAYCLVRFRSRSTSNEPPQMTGNKTVEVAWTSIPLLLVAGMFVLTARAMSRSDPVPKDRDPDLIVIGHQWWWEARYAKSGVITANEIHIPAGKRWLVRLQTADVIHDFWVPQLSRKYDMVPDYPNYLWLEASQPGTFSGACAEYCGTEHAWMRLVVIAEPEAEFEAWQQRQRQSAPAPTSPELARGVQAFQQMTCVNCHVIGGAPNRTQVGPDLTHLASRQTLAAGVVQNTPDNLARWLKNPQAIKPGVMMPNLQLTDAQVTDLVKYLQTLK